MGYLAQKSESSPLHVCCGVLHVLIIPNEVAARQLHGESGYDLLRYAQSKALYTEQHNQTLRDCHIDVGQYEPRKVLLGRAMYVKAQVRGGESEEEGQGH